MSKYPNVSDWLYHEIYNYYPDEDLWRGYHLLDHNEFLLYIKGGNFVAYQRITAPGE